jgi:hypothetical protein
MEHSESIVTIAEALSKAQAEMPVVTKDSENPFLHNKFASLGAIIEAVRPVLKKHGLAFIQFPVSEIDRQGITLVGSEGVLMHSSGEWVSNRVLFPLGEEKGKSVAQVGGSLVTYARRYQITGMLGIVTEEDTDGSVPSQSGKPFGERPDKMRMWTAVQKKHLIDCKYAENDFDAKGMLDLSNLPEKASVEAVEFWGCAYRDKRDEGANPVDSAEYANSEYDAEKARRKQDKAVN